MPINKNALIRYKTLDKCFSNWSKRYYLLDLIEECTIAILDYTGKDSGVSRRQILDDIKYMEDRLGWQIPLERHQDGHKVYYRYSDRDFSINKQPFNQEKINQIHDAIMLLNRFDGIPQFDWLNELANRMEVTSHLGTNVGSVVSFQHNPYLKGLEHFKLIFYSIINKRVLRLSYTPFGREQRTILVSPYYIKQYSNRWFVVGKRDDFNRLSNFALDRIDSVEETAGDYEQSNINFEEYFSDIVGVSMVDKPSIRVVLKVNKKSIGYITTKPIHESQQANPTLLEDGTWQVILNSVQSNYELKSLLLSFGNEIEIVAPESLRDEMKEIIESMYGIYFTKS